MRRRDFLAFTGAGVAGLMLPHGRVIAAEQLLEPGDPVMGKRLADAALQAARQAGASYSTLFLVNEQKYFASSDGSWIDQDVHRIWLPFTATAVDKASGRFRTRNGLTAPMGMGYEFLDGDRSGRFELPGGVVGYGHSDDPREDALATARQAREKLTAPSVKAGRYDVVLDPSNLFLTIHENVGHPLEMDRVLGYEANYAGTSFATLDKRDAGFRWGSDIVNFTADKTQGGSLGAVGYDDEGVKAQRWDLVRDDVLVDYQATRDEAHILGRDASLQLCRFLVQRAVPAHGQRVAGAGQGAAERGGEAEHNHQDVVTLALLFIRLVEQDASANMLPLADYTEIQPQGQRG